MTIDDKETKNQKMEVTEEQREVILRIKKAKNHYQVLGVEKHATEVEIKKSYRKVQSHCFLISKLAVMIHPDKCKTTDAEECFKKIGQAVHTLSDAQKRKTYDLQYEKIILIFQWN
jgi:DnaJ-class molecular chaperone